jgi:hypothetical protein
MLTVAAYCIPASRQEEYVRVPVSCEYYFARFFTNTFSLCTWQGVHIRLRLWRLCGHVRIQEHGHGHTRSLVVLHGQDRTGCRARTVHMPMVPHKCGFDHKYENMFIGFQRRAIRIRSAVRPRTLQPLAATPHSALTSLTASRATPHRRRVHVDARSARRPVPAAWSSI